MSLSASSSLSLEPDSQEAGALVGRAIRQAFPENDLRAALVYATVSHDQQALLAAIREEIGTSVPLLGCSSQGIVLDEDVSDEGFAVGIMGLGGGDLRVSAQVAHDIQVSPHDKGRRLAQDLKQKLDHEPKLVVVLYDSLCGVDVEALLSGMRCELACPCVGGGAAQPWSAPVRTYQYFGDQVFSAGVVALALDGPFSYEIGLCHGTVPLGVSLTVTKSEGNRIVEIDGRRALDVWRDLTGASEGDLLTQEHLASWAIGVERTFTTLGPNGPTQAIAHMIRVAFQIDLKEGSLILQAGIPEGARVMLHQRTVEQVLKGTEAMGHSLSEKISGRTPWAVLGFECAGRTLPFLGPSNTRKEHIALRRAVAPKAAWLGMMPWGEVAPLGSEPAFHNGTYPLVVLTR